MKILTEYKKNGYEFTLVTRKGDYAIFEGTRKTGSKTYEVIQIKSHDGLTFDGVTTDPAEYAPSNNEWGSKGWTYRSLEVAVSKLDKLSEQA